MKKKRLDDILIALGLASGKREAFTLVTEGLVLVNGQKAISPAQPTREGERIELIRGREYVGRGAYKLEAAILRFRVDVRGKVCVDIGSAVGGFVEVLLKYGAKKVYAIDTARGKLDVKLREDLRVEVMEKIDIRDLKTFPKEAGIATIDVSLISLRQILPLVFSLSGERLEVIALFKPQYETRDRKILRHGIVSDDVARQALLDDFMAWAKDGGRQVVGVMESPIRGSEGNVEYLLYLRNK